MTQDEDRSLEQAIKDGDYLVVDLTVSEVREYFDGKDTLEEFTSLLDECQANIYGGDSEEQLIIVRIRK